MIVKGLKTLFFAIAIFAIVPVLFAAGAPPADETAAVGRAADAARFAAAAQTYRFIVWADSVLNGEYGRHEVSFAANSFQQAFSQLSLYQHAWGQQLERDKVHYNSMHSRFLGRQ